MTKIKNKKGGSLNLSASAVSTWEDCPRKWGFSYIERLEPAKSESLTIGIAVHDAAEKYLQSGIPPEDAKTNRWWRILQPGLDLLPSPVVAGEGLPGWHVETWLTDQTCGPLDVKGKIDYWQHTDEGLTIGDWKTTKDPRWRWSKTPDELADLTQPLLYAYCVGQDHGRPSRLDFQHINLRVKGAPAAMDVWAYDVSWDAVDERWGKLVETSEDMASYATIENISALDLPPNIKSCKKYGGCPHAAYCPASHINRHRPLTPAQQQQLVQQSNYNPNNRSTPMADLAALRASLGLNNTPTSDQPTSDQPPAPAQTPAQTPAEAAAEVMEAIRPAVSLGIPRRQLFSACDAKGVPPRVVIQGLKLKELGNLYVTETPQESPDEAETSQALDDVSESTNPAEPTQDKDAPATGGFPFVGLGKDNPAVEAVIKLLNGERRGPVSLHPERTLKDAAKSAVNVRRMGSKRWASIRDAAMQAAGIEELRPNVPPRRVVALSAFSSPPTPDDAPEAPEPPDKEDTNKMQMHELGKKKAANTPSRVEGFVDCNPSGESTTSIIQVLQQHMEQVERDQGVAHYSNVAYNEGTKLVVGLFKQRIQEEGPQGLPSLISVDSRHPLSSNVIEVLERAKFTRVIRGKG